MLILLIDDDPDIRLLAGVVLEQAGHQVSFADSASAGIAAAETDCDVVLLDYRLGDRSGLDVLPALLAARPVRPVVFLTGAEDPEVVRSLSDAGAAGVILKPFDPESLAARVEAIARAHRGA